METKNQKITKIIEKMPTEKLEEELKFLKLNSKSNEEAGSFLTKLTLGPIVAGICFSFLHLIPGLIITGVFGAFFVRGCVYTAKSVKCDELIKKIKTELKKRPTQLAMEDVLKESYKPILVKKTKTKRVAKEHIDDLGL